MKESFENLKKPENKYPGTCIYLISDINKKLGVVDEELIEIKEEIRKLHKSISDDFESDLSLDKKRFNLKTMEDYYSDKKIEKELLEGRKKSIITKISN